MKHIEELEANEIVQCPKCCAEVTEATNIDWKYIDGEKHEVKCPCGNTFKLLCERPIRIQLFAEFAGEL